MRVSRSKKETLVTASIRQCETMRPLGRRLRRAVLAVCLMIGLALGGPWAMAFAETGPAATAGTDIVMDHHHNHSDMGHAPSADDTGPHAVTDQHDHDACVDACSDCCALCGPSTIGGGPGTADLSQQATVIATAFGVLPGLPPAPATEPPKHRS